MRRSAPASAAEGSAGFSVSTAAMSSSRGGVWRSASSNTTEGSAGVSVSGADYVIELAAKINHVVCPGKRGGIATGLFHLNGGSEFVARMGLAVRFVKHDGRASRLFPINGSLGSGRVRCFRASLTLAALHNYTILSQRLDTELSAAPESAPTGKVDKIFLAGVA